MLQFFNPLAWGRWLGQFFYYWLISINWKEVPRSVPAIIVMTTLGVIWMIVNAAQSDWRTRLLKQQFATAWQAEDFATVELVLRRQMELDRGDSDLQFHLGLARWEQEETDDSLAIMRELVETKQHAKAARWLLEKEYIGKKWSDLTDEQREEFGDWLALLSRETPGDVGIKQLYADYLIASERLEKAIPLLSQLAQEFPRERGLQYAAILRRMGDTVAADRQAEQTLAVVSKLAEEEPTNMYLAFEVAQNQLFLHRYPDAVRTLYQSIKRSKSEEQTAQLNQAMGESIVAWVMHIREQGGDPDTQQAQVLKLLQTALEFAPNNPRVLTLVADEVLSTLGEESEQIVKLRNSLVKGSSPAISHFIQGTSALMADDLDKATMHLNIAANLMPRSGAILNNLAVAISTRGDAGLDQALKLSETAIETTPNATPHFYETRGQILYRMGRYLEAVPDLERALAVDSLKQKAHESLAHCYRELGADDLSEQHQAEADSLKSTDQSPLVPEPLE